MPELIPNQFCIFKDWDEISENKFADTVTVLLANEFPENPPQFLQRTPHGYSNTGEFASDIEKGYSKYFPGFETIRARSIATEPSIPVIAYCQGKLLRNGIENLDASLMKHATKIAITALAKRFEKSTIYGKIQGHVETIML